jgi:DNA-binding transcriptional LysR family regulator
MAGFRSQLLIFVAIVLDDLFLVVRAPSTPKTKATAASLNGLPLILPDPDSGFRIWFDKLFRQDRNLEELNPVLETGGWSTILAYVRDGFGVGIVSEAALNGEQGLIIRQLDPNVWTPRVTKLICRYLAPSQAQLDLSTSSEEFRKLLTGASSKVALTSSSE